ncbi:c-type cytochrome [Methylomarinum sp. Ch1-1]|uniref:C-type cytochrome n=1 Tax=Methylomarinum roseum TaxID=3067653 RepID=A0AAU7NVP9_9GAMM
MLAKCPVCLRKTIHPLLTVALLLSTAACSNNTNTTTGFWEEMRADVAVNNGPSRTGKQVYDYRCKSCHARNTQGAPMPGDEYEWRQRVQKGMDVLMEHTINGYQRTLMPARGGCLDCNDTELRNAVLYMLSKSGIELNNQD